MVNENTGKINVRIGRFTFGITMILFGISILIQMIFKLEVFRYILMFWPLIFIILGIETIYLTSKKNVNIRYDVAGIIFTGIILFIGTIMSFCSLVINKVVYDDTVKSAVLETVSGENLNYYFTEKIQINNLTDKNIKVRIIENKSYENIKVMINAKYNKEKFDNVIAAISGRYSLSNIASLDSYEKSILCINSYPEYIDEIVITIITNAKEKVNVTGNVTIQE